MSDRRLLFYNDTRYYYLYCYEPPISMEDARAPVDEIAGSGVDTFVYGVGPAVGDMCGPQIKVLIVANDDMLHGLLRA